MQGRSVRIDAARIRFVAVLLSRISAKTHAIARQILRIIM